jgi:dTDP-4-amino-4,6-dideoxygalactose transaminase
MGGVAVARDRDVAEALARIASAAPFPGDETVEGRLHQLVSEYHRYKAPDRWWRGEIARDQRHDFPPQLTREEKRGERPASYGRRIPAPLAEVGMNQLAKLDRYNERRRRTAATWDAWCASHGYEAPLVIPGSVPVYLRYPVMVEAGCKGSRSWSYRHVGTNTGDWFRTHTHPVPSGLSGFPCADEAVARCINLPCLVEQE